MLRLKDRRLSLLIIFGFVLGLWWITIYFSQEKDPWVYYFGLAYPVVAIFGGYNGMVIGKSWGGLKSVMGKSVYFFSLGMFSYAFGQLVWSYYNIILQVEIPYPSIADIGYVSAIPFYLLGVIYLGNASGVRFGFKKMYAKIQATILPLLGLLISYFVFLRDYEFVVPGEYIEYIKVFIDFGYPLGQALTVAVAILVLLLSRDYLGGIMKPRIWYILFALSFQYVTDFSFLYQASKGTYYNGGIVDLMYAISLIVMGVGLLFLDYDYLSISEKN